MSAALAQDMGGAAGDPAMKKVPDNFDEDDDDLGDIEENADRGRPGPTA